MELFRCYHLKIKCPKIVQPIVLFALPWGYFLFFARPFRGNFFIPILHGVIHCEAIHAMYILKKVFLLSPIIAGILLFSCEEKKKLDTKKISSEIKSRKIRRITPSEILNTADLTGKKMVAGIEHNWLEALQLGMESKGVEYTKKFCIVPFIPGYDTIVTEGMEIKKIGRNNLKMPGKLTSLEKQLLDAYLYNVEQKIPLTGNLQKEGEDYLLYTSPIYFKEDICLQCHKKEGGETAFKKGDFAGIWSVRLSKKKLILDME